MAQRAPHEVTLEFASDKTTFYLKATVKCSSKTLLKMVGKGTACYTLHVECSNTLFREKYDFDTAEYRVAIPASLLHDAVEVNAFVRAKAEVPRYTVEGAHPDYQGATFGIRSGDILAIADGQTFDADQTVDPMRRVGALMVVEKSPKAGDHPMEADFDEDKIRILLCEADFLTYGELKVVPHLTSHLTTTLVLPVLMQAIHLLEEGDDVTECKWATLLRRRIEKLDLGSTADALLIAQRLLELPIRRALASAKQFLAVSGT